MEDVWRGEVQDLLSQITQLQTENKRLLGSLSVKESSITEEEQHTQEGRWSATSTALCLGSRDEFEFLNSLWAFFKKKKNSFIIMPILVK